MSRFALLLLTVMIAGCRPPETPTPVFTAGELSAVEQLLPRIDRVLDHTLHQRRLNSRDHAAWQVVHAILAFGDELEIEHQGINVRALDWLLAGNRLEGWNLRPGDRGVIAPVEQGSKAGQGHPDQWLGYLSQTGLSPNAELKLAGGTYTVRDLLTQACWDITNGQEATWTLMALSHPDYWNLDQGWKNRYGEDWTVERVAEMEARAPVVGAACGGTHRLYALAVAVNNRAQKSGVSPGQLTGGWQTAERRVREFKQLARVRFQNGDGTFSGHYFERPGQATDVSDQVATTGHIFEFLVAAMTDDELREPWMTAAAERMTELLEQAADLPLDVGGLYHAAHGLLLYRDRMTARGE